MWKPKDTGSGKGNKYTVSKKLASDNLFDWTFKIYNKFVTINKYVENKISSYTGSRGIFCGGYSYTNSIVNQTIDYITISTLSNTNLFGNTNITTSGWGMACSNGSIIMSSYPYYSNVIYSVTASTTGNASTFGNILNAVGYYGTACCNGTRGLFITGQVITYITSFSSGVTSIAFGSISQGYISNGPSSCNSSTRALMTAGANVISYVEISTTSNTSIFGYATQPSEVTVNNNATVTDGIKAIFIAGMNGGTAGNVIQYFTFSTLGNSTDFGDTIASRGWVSGVTNGSRGVISGGYTGGDINTMDYITISNISNAIDFGDMSYNRSATCAASGN